MFVLKKRKVLVNKIFISFSKLFSNKRHINLIKYFIRNLEFLKISYIYKQLL